MWALKGRVRQSEEKKVSYGGSEQLAALVC